MKFDITVYKQGKSVTYAQLDTFFDAFVDFVESKGMVCGGGITLCDMDGE